MTMTNTLVVFICYMVVCSAMSNVHDKMYTQLNATTPCILRLNGSQSFGCTSSRSGNVGVVHLVHNSTDLDWVLKAAPMDSYIVAMFLEMFSFRNLKKLNESDRIVGVLLMQQPSRQKTYFSPEDTCPNRYSGLAVSPASKATCDDRQSPWNPRTMYSGISMHKWNMPIFFTDDNATAKNVENCFNRFNVPLSTQHERSLCALKMSAHMYGSVDSTTCIRRSGTPYNINPVRYCDPLGDDNIWAPVIPFDRTPKPKQKYVIVAARLDSTSLFYGLASGALSTATSLVTLLCTANLLFDLTQRSMAARNYDENVLFILFNGEAYDYIGSSRIVFDMERNAFPFPEYSIKLDDISLFVELSQLRRNDTVVYHAYKSVDTKVSAFVETFENVSAAYPFRVVNSTSSKSTFPPASFQSFLAKKENISGFVFGSYDRQFTNRYYHSLYDDVANVEFTYANGTRIADDSLQSFVANFSTALARTLYQHMTGEPADESRTADCRLVDELLQCYLNSMSCEFARSIDFHIDPMQGRKLDYYVGVNLLRNQLTTLTKYAFVHLMSRNVTAASKEDCATKANPTQYTHAFWIETQSRCLESAVNVSDAVSPAFIVAEYDLADGVYSSWTESSWQTIDVLMFAQPSSAYERLVFAVGNAILVTSFVVVFWIKRNSHELFDYPHLMSASNI